MRTETRPGVPSRVFCSAAEAAEMLGVSAPTVHKLIRAGELHAFVPIPGGRKQLLYTQEVDLLARLRRQDSDAAVEERIREIKEALRCRMLDVGCWI